jgi:hypothetical protein
MSAKGRSLLVSVSYCRPICCGAEGGFDEGFSMRATARGFGGRLTLARVDKPLKEEAVGC